MSTPAEEPAKTEAVPEEKPARRGMRKRNKILLIIFSLVLMAVFRTGFIFVLVGLLPAIVTYYIDRTPHRHRYKTVLACNLSGLMPYIATMLSEGPTSSVQTTIMQDPATWIVIYGSALMGYLLIRIAPVIAHIFISSLHQQQVSMLERSQRRIEEEWGQEVVLFSRADHH